MIKNKKYIFILILFLTAFFINDFAASAENGDLEKVLKNWKIL